MSNQRYAKAIELFNYCLENNISLKNGCNHLNVGDSYPRRSRHKLAEAFRNNEISGAELANFNELYEKVLGRNQATFAAPEITPAGVSIDYATDLLGYQHETRPLHAELHHEVDLDADEKFDERSKGWAIRNDKQQIIGYGYKILVRDELPLTGSLTREEMERIYSEYPYTTLNNVSTDFPTLTVMDLKRVIRTFGITKDRLFPQHIVEEYSEEKVAEFALKAKEKSSYKKFAAQKAVYIEGKLRETQDRLNNVLEDRQWADRLVEKYLTNRTITPVVRPAQEFNFIGSTAPKRILSGTTFAVISDFHFGKHFPTSKISFGRGSDKNILRERCLEATQIMLDEADRDGSISLHIPVLGDILESMQPSGQHAQHTQEMDLLGDDQLMYAIGVFEEMFEELVSKFKGNEIVLQGLGGNHDRILPTHNEDRKRTGAMLFYKMLKKVFELKYGDLVKVLIYEEGVMAFEQDGLSFIATHGDAPVGKKPAIELMNLFKVGDSKNYTVILKGHLHHSKQVDEGPNFVYLQAGAICSSDGYTQNQLGVGAQPSLLTIKRATKYGVNYKKTTLW